VQTYVWSKSSRNLYLTMSWWLKLNTIQVSYKNYTAVIRPMQNMCRLHYFVRDSCQCFNRWSSNRLCHKHALSLLKVPDISFYFSCKTEFRDTFHDLPTPNNSTVSALISCFCDMSMQDRKWSGWTSVLRDDTVDSIHLTLLSYPRH